MKKRNIFISGASRGIGKSMAKHFAKSNFNVVGTSRNNFKFDDDLENLLPIKLDVTSRNDVKDCFETINRGIFAFNQGLDKIFFKRIAKGNK